jgi:protocatechuate 3,4-dioxygenase beta subunit
MTALPPVESTARNVHLDPTGMLPGRRRLLAAAGALGLTALFGELLALPAARIGRARAATLAAPDGNQQGLTGIWGDTTLPGQGIFLETYPDLLGDGIGFVFGGWFTYDTTAGGVERQRWFSFSGRLVEGTSSAEITLYQNTGGNFAATPVTFATAVGSGTLSFASCTAASLAWRFDDGRSGTLALGRSLSSIACTSSDTTGTRNADFALSGLWSNSALSGQGIGLEVNPVSGAAALGWYTYAPSGQSAAAAGQRWFSGQASYSAGARHVVFTLYQNTGGTFGGSNAVTTTAVGTGTLTFSSCDTAVWDYAFTAGELAGRSGRFSLTRAGETPTACNFGGSCTLIPQETQGPYPLLSVLSNASIVRQDITEGKAGVPLTLALRLVDVNDGCSAIADAAIYAWHCDKDGVYSGYANQTGGVNATGQQFLRGVQYTDAGGQAVFRTVYPGWYNGRITHIHFQVYLSTLGGTATATSQIAFPPEVTRAVYASALYAARGQNTSVTSFSADNVFSDGVSYQLSAVSGSVASGLTATLTIGIAR